MSATTKSTKRTTTSTAPASTQKRPAAKSQAAKRARRIIRQYLAACTLAADESQDAETRTYAADRAETLAPKFEQATSLIYR